MKSGKNYQTHSALTYFMTTKYFNKTFVLSDYNISVKNNIIYFPIYMTMFIKKCTNYEWLYLAKRCKLWVIIHCKKVQVMDRKYLKNLIEWNN